MRHLCKLPVPALWKKVQETRRPERPHGEVHEQVGGLANQSVQRLPHGIDLPLDHVDPLHPHHLGDLQPCHDNSSLWRALNPGVSLDPRATKANREQRNESHFYFNGTRLSYFNWDAFISITPMGVAIRTRKQFGCQFVLKTFYPHNCVW